MNPVMILRKVKSITRHVDGNDHEYDAVIFWCPGCERPDVEGVMIGGIHMLPVNTDAPVTSWTFDGNLEAPTLSPSILSRMKPYGDKPEFVCHSFLNAGVFDFLSDSTHQYSGQKVPMVPLPDWVVNEDG